MFPVVYVSQVMVTVPVTVAARDDDENEIERHKIRRSRKRYLVFKFLVSMINLLFQISLFALEQRIN